MTPTSFTVQPTELLIGLGVLALVGVLLLAWLVRKVLRSNFAFAAWSYFSQSFEDARDRPDAKLLTLFSAFGLIILIVVWGLCTHYWPPEWVFLGLIGFVAAGYKFSADENRAKIKSEGDTAMARITGQNPVTTDATATTTTTTTVGTE
jgi:hypothetical protein